MQKLKNIFVGFLVSFIGSIPLGYLNIVGYELYKISGLNETILYLLGVILIEFFVIYLTLLFANQILANKKLIKFIEAFSIFFMFLLAYTFYLSAAKKTSNESILENYVYYSPFFIGIVLSGLNFIQIPFWTSWNIYLLNEKYIETSKSKKYFYILGAILGTFLGMLFLILSLDYVTHKTNFLSKYLMKIIIPSIFTLLGLVQSFKFYRKYIPVV